MVKNINNKWLFNNKIALYSLLSIALFVLSYILDGFFENSVNDRGRITSRTERILREKEEKTCSILEEIAGCLENKPGFHQLDSVTGVLKPEQNGVLVYVYHQDSLVYWSDNLVIPQPSTEEAPGDAKIVKYSNGWYLSIERETDSYRIIGLVLIKFQYPYQNKYLVNGFHEDFRLGKEIGLVLEKGSFPVRAANGNVLFYLEFPDHSTVPEGHVVILFALFLVGLLFLMAALLHAYLAIDFIRQRRILLLTGLLLDMVIIRLLILHFKIPAFLYETDLFGPGLFATSYLNPSLGDLLINTLLLLFYAAAFHYYSDISLIKPRRKWRIVLAPLLFSGVALSFYELVSFLRVLVMDSSIEMNLNNIFSTNIYSLLGFTALAALILSVFLISVSLIRFIYRISANRREFMTMAVIFLILCVVAALLFGISSFGIGVSIMAAFILSFGYFLAKKGDYRTLGAAVFFIFLFSLLSTIFMNRFQRFKEAEYRRLLAIELTSKRDPLLEYEFRKINTRIMADSVLSGMIAEGREDDPIATYLDENYFNSFWNKYELLITICGHEEILNIQPEDYLENCFDYFTGLVQTLGEKTLGENLYFINNKTGSSNYLAHFDFSDSTGDSVRIYVELYYKFVTETGLGYPDLLIDKEANITSDLSSYSYARYDRQSLKYKFGDFSYNLDFSPFDHPGEKSYFTDLQGYSHYVLKQDDGTALVLSRKKNSVLDTAAPFSFLFIYFSLFLLLFVLVLNVPRGFRALEFNFRNQLQTAIIFLIVLSFIAIGLITRASIIRLNSNKNKDILSEKAFSVLVEVEHKLADQQQITTDMGSYIAELMYKFSQVFFSDINVFDTAGNLMASSRPQIFDEDLLSRKMNPAAFEKLSYDKSLLFIQNEKIGEQEYLSAYLPFRNTQDKVIAYLNLPYFAKQTEMRKEIADFLAAFTNMYVLLIVFAILLTILVSRYITKPLRLIREKMGRVRYGNANEKIIWKREDEIGSLVSEYNRMLDELARSAELLARSERESAWREMAMQVAHEIKNPLTPMKLSVQHLKRAWDDKSPEFEERLERFTRTIIDQIESLSEIASEFSDFAKMPAGKSEEVELTEVIRNSIGIFRNEEHIRFVTDFDRENYPILADHRQLLRVFNNLIKNSVQAIGKRENGLVEITVRAEKDRLIIKIHDNGSGISMEQSDKIFSPSFTTKSSGMGLGLTMVKSILNSMNAGITFDSEVGVGTTFTLEFPLVQN